MKTNVIVTGGAGFIGSCLCKVLAQKNFNPVTVDNLSTGYRQLVKFGDFVEADFGDYEKMVEVFKKFKPLAIFHIAGSKSVEESMRDPHKYFLNNVSKTNELLKATVDCGIENFIFSSTAVIFEESESISENSPKKPKNNYGLSKLIAEQLIESYGKAHDLKFSLLRYFNVTGADPDLEVGEITTKPANIFPILCKIASEKISDFTIFGEDYETHDGTCIRDYIHVHDIAKAHLLALEKMIQNKSSFSANLGNGRGFSVKEVSSMFRKVSGSNFKIIIGEKRSGDPTNLVANIDFAQKYLGWKPKFSNLEDQINHSWSWHQKTFYDTSNKN
jgi:UDP-glucose 4-epimerase